MDVALATAQHQLRALPDRPAAPEIQRLHDAGQQIYRTSNTLADRMRKQPERFDAAALRAAGAELRTLEPVLRQVGSDLIHVTHPLSPWINGMGALPMDRLYWSWQDTTSRAYDAKHRTEAALKTVLGELDAIAANPTVEGVKRLSGRMRDINEGVWIGGAVEALNEMRYFDTPDRQTARLFSKIDLDGNGRIDIATEHERTFEERNVFVPTMRKENYDARLRSIDRMGNRDGVVSAAEAASFFTTADSDRDGWLSAADLAAAQGMFPVVAHGRMKLNRSADWGAWGRINEAATEG